MTESDLRSAFLPRLVRVYFGVLAGFEKRTGIHLARWRILFVLHDSGRCTQRHLAGTTVIDPAAISRILREFEREGLVTRETDPADHRRTLVALTPAGTAKVRDIAVRRAAFLEETLAGLPAAELKPMIAGLAAIEDNLAALP